MVRITDDLIEFARVVAVKTMRTWPHWEREEGYADAMVGLVLAARSFRPELGHEFTTYAFSRIRGEVLDGIRARLGRLDHSHGRIHSTARPLHLVDMDVVDENAAASFDQIEVVDRRAQLVRAINRLSHRNRLVVTLYYFEDMTLRAVGEALGLTESRICQIVRHIKRSGVFADVIAR